MSFALNPDRKSSYKLPPTTIRDKLVSQDARRNKALEDQKRRRAQRVDSTRQLDIFADLTLESDDENADAETIATAEDVDEGAGFTVAPTSIAQYASMLSQGNAFSSPNINASPSFSTTPNLTTKIDGGTPASISNISPTSKKKRPSNKNKRRSNKNKPSKWADRCMYAELLEMNADVPWDLHPPNSYDSHDDNAMDGLPKDLESGWVAVAPVPVGKRCLAVTQQSAGVSGVVPNTTLRSRLLGKGLLARFPSALPPLTVLDCILDSRWRENGILHVLDVVKWKGQDVADCEAGFRFWWRDTRLSELADTPPPASINFLTLQSSEATSGSNSAPKYHFPYPTSFVPVPYHSNTTLSNLEHEVIPAARMWRDVKVSIPVGSSASSLLTMEVEPLDVNSPFSFSSHQATSSSSSSKLQITLTPASARVEPDGMLLYVSEASYEPGTSPLSSWVPIKGYDAHEDGVVKEGPLDLFRRLVRRRLSRQIPHPTILETGMDQKNGQRLGDKLDEDVEMES